MKECGMKVFITTSMSSKDPFKVKYKDYTPITTS